MHLDLPLRSDRRLRGGSPPAQQRCCRFHVRSQPIWQESVRRMKRETFCSCLLMPVGTASMSKSFIPLKLPVATSNQIVWQMITKRAQGRSDRRAPLYVQGSSVLSAERYHIRKEWKSWRKSSSNWEKGWQAKWLPLYKGHFFSCHPHKWALKLMQAIAAISKAGSSAPCKDGSLRLTQPLYMTVKPILPSVFCASHFSSFICPLFCQQRRLLICRIKCNSCWIFFQQEMEFLVVVVQFCFSSKSDCFPD